jgi:hypothetical protein
MARFGISGAELSGSASLLMESGARFLLHKVIFTDHHLVFGYFTLQGQYINFCLQVCSLLSTG